jgi:hypothetical protein
MSEESKKGSHKNQGNMKPFKQSSAAFLIQLAPKPGNKCMRYEKKGFSKAVHTGEIG